jgi:radical SAM PhpK family P-methyltransferase
VEHEGSPYRALDFLNHFNGGEARDLHNSDFLWPVIAYLGSYLDRHGLSFDYVNLFQRGKEKLASLLRAGRIRSVAITTTVYVEPSPIIEIVEFVRAAAPDVPIIVGGPYVANLAATTDSQATLDGLLEYLEADVYVIGREGEKTLAQVVQCLREGHGLAGVPNLAYRDRDGMHRTLPLLESNPLEENMVEYSLFPASEFAHFITTRTAKSCPFSCSFCGFPQRAGKYTYLDLADVERELDRIAEIPSVDTVTFIDDTFNVPKVRFREILQLMIDKHYDFTWNCYYRSDHGDDATIDLMRRAGCEGAFLGVESGSDDQLKRMNKTARRKDYIRAISAFRDAGIITYASLIIGFPGETEQTVEETRTFVHEAAPDYFRTQLWFCDPLTPIWEKRDDYGVQGLGFNWSHSSMSAAQACEHINRMFKEPFESVWLPQFGFEFWSLFYLQRMGMSRERIRQYLRAFNRVVERQAIDEVSDPELFAELRNLAELRLTGTP